MTGREWDEVNDVAVISWQSKSGRHGGSGIALRCSESYNETHWRTQTFGCIDDEIVTQVRPLVVIDPEDMRDIERLFAALKANVGMATLQAALREFASPTPPKPDEPLGLGAVVEDADGRRYIRIDSERMGWIDQDCASYRWTEFAAVKVLSEGVRDE